MATELKGGKPHSTFHLLPASSSSQKSPAHVGLGPYQPMHAPLLRN